MIGIITMTEANKPFQKLKRQFEEFSDPQKAIKMSAYMKDHFSFYGIQTPQRRKLYSNIIKADKQSKQINWELLQLAWKQPQREWQYFVCDYLIALKTIIQTNDLARIKTFSRTKQWWDTIDQLDEVYGALSMKDKDVKTLILTYSKDENFWIRRIAIDHQLGFKEKTDNQLLQQIILNNLESKEFFINKAIGWALRDYSKTNPSWVKQFISTHQDKLAPLSIREASKYLH